MRAKMFLILAISLAACNPAPSTLPSSSSAPVVGSIVPVGQPEIRDLGPSTETVWNCGSGGGTVVKHPSMSVATNWAVEWEVGGTAGTGVRIGDGVIPGGVDLSVSLEGHYANKFDQSIQQGTGWDLPAEPNTVVVYTLMWREVWQPGYVDVSLADQRVVRVNVRYRTGIQSEIVGKQQQSCGAEQQTSQPIATPPSTTGMSNTQTREQKLQAFLNDLNSRYSDVGFYAIKFNESEGSYWIGIRKSGSDLPAITLPSNNVAGNYEFHFWDGENGGDVGRPGETIDPYGSDPQTGLIGTLWFLP